MALLELSYSGVVDTLKAEALDRKARWKRQREWMDLYRKLILFEHYGPGKTGEISRFLPNDGTNIVNMMVGFITAERVSFDAQSIEPSYSALPQSSEVERWVSGVINRNAERQGGNPYHQALYNAIGLGMGVTYCYWDTELASRAQSFSVVDGELELNELGLPVTVYTDCPIIIKSIWPYYIYPEGGAPEGMGRFRSVLRVQKESISSIQETWDVDLPEARGKRPIDLTKADDRHGVEVIDYWGWEKQDGDWVMVNSIVAGKTLVRSPEPMEGYSDVPYNIFSAYHAGFPEYENQYQGALHSVHHAILQLADLQSSMMKNVRRALSFPLFRRIPRGQAGSRIQIDRDIWNILDLHGGEDIVSPNLPGFDSQATFEQGWIKDQIREGSFSIPLLSQSLSSGIAGTRIVEQSIVRLAQPRLALEDAMRQDISKIRSYAAAFAPDQPIRLLSKYRGVSGTVELTGSQLTDFVVDVSLGGELPLDDMRKMQIGLQLDALGERSSLSRRERLKRFWNVDQPEDMEYEKTYEMALAHPVMQAAALSDALKELGVNISPQEILGVQPQGRMQPLPETEARLPGAIQAPQEAQSAEFGMAGQNASMMGQGPPLMGPLGPTFP